MKNRILCCLAAASLALSFFFEQAPAPTGPGAPVAAEASLFPDFLGNEPENSPNNRASYRDSVQYAELSHALGVKLTYTENKDLLRTVTEWLGTPYHYGSNSKRGTDCSGFVTRVFQEVYGITLQRSSRSMFQTVQRVAKDDMQSGDLVFFRRGPGQPIYHVGIYLTNGKFAHSATNGGVMVSSLSQPYYQRNFYAAGRVAHP